MDGKKRGVKLEGKKNANRNWVAEARSTTAYYSATQLRMSRGGGVCVVLGAVRNLVLTPESIPLPSRRLSVDPMPQRPRPLSRGF